MPFEERNISATVEGEAEGRRLDLWLAARFTYRSRNQWQTIIREDKILVNGAVVRSSRVLHAGDVVYVTRHHLPYGSHDYFYRG